MLDVSSDTWRSARHEVLPRGHDRDTCTRRLVQAGLLRPIVRGRFLVVDPNCEVSPIAVASALFRNRPHYVSTDAAFTLHGFDTGVPESITVVMPKTHRRVAIEGSVVVPVTIAAGWFSSMRWAPYRVPDGGHEVALASVEQAIADSIARPSWCADRALVGRVLRERDRYDLALMRRLVEDRGQASVTRLDRLLRPFIPRRSPATAGASRRH